jgi:hypothetical protein
MCVQGAVANMLPLDQFSEMREQLRSASVFPLPVQKRASKKITTIPLSAIRKLIQRSRSHLSRATLLQSGAEGKIHMGNLSGVVQQLRKERTRLADELHSVTAALTAFGKVYIYVSKNNSRVATGRKRTLSAAGRKRIAAAQRARWAKQKAGQAQKPKRTMSAAARRKIAAAQRARWAVWKAKQQKAA